MHGLEFCFSGNREMKVAIVKRHQTHFEISDPETRSTVPSKVLRIQYGECVLQHCIVSRAAAVV